MSDILHDHPLDDTHVLSVGELPASLRLDDERFETLWALRPAERPVIRIHGRHVRAPRWQQAYGADYRYSGQVSRALPVPPLLESLHRWVRAHVDPRLDGLLLNWYDAEARHYIGPHRDSTSGMVRGAPIVTVSFGAARTFRVRPHRGRERIDFRATDGTVFVMPWETNRAFTHEVPHFARDHGRRISVTFRAFAE